MKVSEFTAKDGTIVHITWDSGYIHSVKLIRVIEEELATEEEGQ